MLDAALKFIAAQVNAHLLKRTGSALGQVSLGPVVDDAGKWVVAPNTVQLTLVNVEQEPTLRNVPGERVQIDDRHDAPAVDEHPGDPGRRAVDRGEPHARHDLADAADVHRDLVRPDLEHEAQHRRKS